MAIVTGLTLWGVAAAIVVGALNQYLFTTTLDAGTGLALIGVLVVGAPVILGLLGGVFVRADRPHQEVLLIAAVGAACVFVALDLLWNASPTACSAANGCDVSLGFGAALVAGLSLVPFLTGTALGSLIRRLLARRMS